jgi:nucleotide-binding universal stress UspA family protein
MSGIVVGIDGFGHSQRALEWAMREAALRQAPLTVVTAHPTAVNYLGSTVSYSEDDPLTERARKAAQQETDEVLKKIGEPAPQVTVQAVSGTPAEELLSAAEDADLLVVGPRDAGGFARLVMGSVSSQVAHHAHCPVVIIPAEDR